MNFRNRNMCLCVAAMLIATAAWTAAQAAEDKVAWMMQTNALEKTVATYVCKEPSVPTTDRHAVGERNYRHQPDRCHYDDVGNDALAECICTEIKRALKNDSDANKPEAAK